MRRDRLANLDLHKYRVIEWALVGHVKRDLNFFFYYPLNYFIGFKVFKQPTQNVYHITFLQGGGKYYH
jgi:hypothetical protein